MLFELEEGESERRQRKREEVRKANRKRKLPLLSSSPKEDLSGQGPDERDAGDREVYVRGQLSAVFREVHDADGGLGEADDEEVVGVGEEADAGDEDGLRLCFFVLRG